MRTRMVERVRSGLVMPRVFACLLPGLLALGCQSTSAIKPASAAATASAPATPATPASPGNAAPAGAAFETLKTLVGNWQMKTRRGPIRLNYRLFASASVLVETFVTPSGNASLTLYHLDGHTLMATHYCPQGNQPRLRWTGQAGDLRFEFLDATGLEAEEAYLRSFTVRVGPKTLTKVETYWADGARDTSTLTFHRTGQ